MRECRAFSAVLVSASRAGLCEKVVSPMRVLFALVAVIDDPTQITAAHPATDLLLDVWINKLSLGWSSQDSSKRQVNYAAEIRLIDAKVVRLIDGKKGLVIAHGRCIRTPAETPSPPSYDDFLANGAQRLKDEFADATRFCVDEFRSKVLTAGQAP